MEWGDFWLKVLATWWAIAVVALPMWLCTDRKIFHDICCASIGGGLAALVALIWSL